MKQLAPGVTCGAAVSSSSEICSPRVVHRSLEDDHVAQVKPGELDVTTTESDERRRHDHVEGVQAVDSHVDGGHEALGVATKHRVSDEFGRLTDVPEVGEDGLCFRLQLEDTQEYSDAAVCVVTAGTVHFPSIAHGCLLLMLQLRPSLSYQPLLLGSKQVVSVAGTQCLLEGRRSCDGRFILKRAPVKLCLL